MTLHLQPSHHMHPVAGLLLQHAAAHPSYLCWLSSVNAPAQGRLLHNVHMPVCNVLLMRVGDLEGHLLHVARDELATCMEVYAGICAQYAFGQSIWALSNVS